MTTLKNSKYDLIKKKTGQKKEKKKIKMWQFYNLNCDQTQTLKKIQNSKNQITTKLRNQI